jgi:D-sedoheptulose 7-phosphate isomerase
MLSREEAAARTRALFARSIELKRAMAEHQSERIAEIAETCVKALGAGGKLMLCGNGGSAADAQHLAAELLVRLTSHLDRAPIPALALALDSSSLTACGNDYSYDEYYARMVQALGRPGDVLLALSTSGRSPSVVRALEAARAMGVATVGFLGSGGGAALAHCDLALVVPSDETGRVQEAHITAGHALLELVEEGLLAAGRIVPAPRG